MYKNKGIESEDNIIDALNNKRFGELNNNLKHMINIMFGTVSLYEKIQCERVMGFQKPDVVITCKGEEKYVSLKSGSARQVHEEEIRSFILFIRSLGISEDTQKLILLFQYGDGTLNGTGLERQDYNALMYMYGKFIQLANRELNSNKDFVLQVIDRCLFTGVIEPGLRADYIYHGDVDYGVIASRTQIMKHITRRDWAYMKGLHIGPLLLRPHARYVGRDIYSEKRRHRINLDWHYFADDLKYISGRYDG